MLLLNYREKSRVCLRLVERKERKWGKLQKMINAIKEGMVEDEDSIFFPSSTFFFTATTKASREELQSQTTRLPIVRRI